MTSWKEMLIKAFKETGDDFKEMETTLTDDELIKEFKNSYGRSKGVHFTSWGEKYVYFPVVHDGKEWVGYAPRNVCDIKTFHIGRE